jgi:hypothetical protein
MSTSFVSQQHRVGLTHRALPSSSSAIARDENQESMRIHLAEERRNHLHITVSIFKGVTLGAAAYALLAILTANGTVDARAQITALVFWLAGFTAMIVTYDGTMLSSLVTITATNVMDLVVPFLFGITEFSLFPILVPVVPPGGRTPSSSAAMTHLAWWPLGFALLVLIGSIDLINSQNALTATMKELPPHLQSFILRVRSLLKKNQYATAGSLAFYLAAFLALRYGFPHVASLNRFASASELRQWEGVLGLFVIANNIFGIWTIEQTRRELAEALVAAPQDY